MIAVSGLDMATWDALAKAGEDVKLMVDFNQGHSLGDALHRCHDLDNQSLYWFEEPIAYDNLAGYTQLTRELKTPVQLGENFYGPRTLSSATASTSEVEASSSIEPSCCIRIDTAPFGSEPKSPLHGVDASDRSSQRLLNGGGGGIRTRETVHHRLHALQACAFDRSATPPWRDVLARRSTPGQTSEAGGWAQ
jgi:hypothetical protein